MGWQTDVLLIIKKEIDDMAYYLKHRGRELTTGECMQEIGNLRLLVNKLLSEAKK